MAFEAVNKRLVRFRALLKEKGLDAFVLLVLETQHGELPLPVGLQGEQRCARRRPGERASGDGRALSHSGRGGDAI